MIKIEKVVKSTKRVGRGRSSGKGKTSGRGMNGQKSRNGSSTVFFEGGQTKLTQRLPKAGGFKSRRQDTTLVLTSTKINRIYKDGETVSLKSALEKLKLPEKTAQKYKNVKVIKSQELKVTVKFDELVKLSKSFAVKG